MFLGFVGVGCGGTVDAALGVGGAGGGTGQKAVSAAEFQLGVVVDLPPVGFPWSRQRQSRASIRRLASPLSSGSGFIKPEFGGNDSEAIGAQRSRKYPVQFVTHGLATYGRQPGYFFLRVRGGLP